MAKYRLIPDEYGGYQIHICVSVQDRDPVYKYVSAARDEEKARKIIANLERPVIEIGEYDE